MYLYLWVSYSFFLQHSFRILVLDKWLLQHQCPFNGFIQHVSFSPFTKRHFIFFFICAQSFFTLRVFQHQCCPNFLLLQHVLLPTLCILHFAVLFNLQVLFIIYFNEQKNSMLNKYLLYRSFLGRYLSVVPWSLLIGRSLVVPWSFLGRSLVVPWLFLINQTQDCP